MGSSRLLNMCMRKKLLRIGLALDDFRVNLRKDLFRLVMSESKDNSMIGYLNKYLEIQTKAGLKWQLHILAGEKRGMFEFSVIA